MTGRACEMFEATFNRNIKLTYNLPYPTHRNLLQPISNLKPLRVILAKRFLTFTKKLRQSEKPVLRSMIGLVEHDVQTVTGRNLRRILQLTEKPSIQNLKASDMDDVNLHGDPELWRVLAIKEILEIRAGELQLPDGWAQGELETILMAACCD